MPHYKNARVLVAGGAGFTGSNLAIRLVNEGAKAAAAASFLTSLGGNERNREEISDKIDLIQKSYPVLGGAYGLNIPVKDSIKKAPLFRKGKENPPGEECRRPVT
jgi:hypothetical protein